MRRLLFGAKSERFIPESSTASAQLDLQILMQEAAQPAVKMPQEEVMVKKSTSAQKPTGRQALPAHLPRIDTVLEPTEDTSGMKKIGEEITERLDYQPGKLIVGG